MTEDRFIGYGAWGEMTSPGNFTGFLGDLIAENVDTSNVWHRYTKIRQEYFSFSHPISYGENSLGFVIQKPDGMSAIASSELLYKVFEPLVWAAILTSILLVMILLCVAPNFKRWVDTGFVPTSVRDLNTRGAWDTLTMCVNQHFSEAETHTAFGNIALLCGGFLILFSATLYEGGLAGSLIGHTTSLPFTTMTELAEEVAKKSDFFHYTFMLHVVRDTGAGNGFFWDMIVNPDLLPYRLLNASLQRNPVGRLGTVDDVYDKIEGDPTLVFPGQDFSDALPHIKRRCNVVFLRDADATFSVPAGFIFPKNSKWPDIFNPVMSGLAPIVQHLERKYLSIEQYKDRKDCLAASTHAGDPLTLRHYTGIFSIACFMFIISIISLFAELGMSYYKNRRLKRYHERRPAIQAKIRVIGRMEKESRLRTANLPQLKHSRA